MSYFKKPLFVKNIGKRFFRDLDFGFNEMDLSAENEDKIETEFYEQLRCEYFQARNYQNFIKNQQFSKKLISNPMKIYENTFGQSACFQPPIQYCISFLKFLIKQVEKADELSNEENLSIWYDELEKINSSGRNLVEPFYRIYLLDKNNDNDPLYVKIHENESAFVSHGTTGFLTWEASIELSKWLPSYLSTNGFKWIFELGSGCGYLACSTLKLIPEIKKYVISEGHNGALEKCKENINSNNLADGNRINYELIDWKSDQDKFKEITHENIKSFGKGLLIGADIIFDTELIGPLVVLFKAFLEEKSQDPTGENSVLLSCTIRNENTIQNLRDTIGLNHQIKLHEVKKWENGTILQLNL